MSAGSSEVGLGGRGGENAAAAAVLLKAVEEATTFSSNNEVVTNGALNGKRNDNIDGGVQYVRIGRRTIEDDGGDIPTQCIVVIRNDTLKGTMKWLSVATWQLNGLRIGHVEHGDVLKEDTDLERTTCLDPDPYFFARNILSAPTIRSHILALARAGVVPSVPETLDDEVASKQRREVSWALLGLEHEDSDGAAEPNIEARFPYPWALPTAPGRSNMRFTDGFGAFDRSMTTGNELDLINVVAVFVNTIEEHDLRLTHYIQCDFDPDDTVGDIKKYFRDGDGKLDGLQNNHYLRGLYWSMELWVLPQLDGCSTLFKWDAVPELKAKGWCDAASIQAGGTGTGKLYVEVRIVPDPERDALERF